MYRVQYHHQHERPVGLMDNRDESIVKLLILYEQQMDNFPEYLITIIVNVILPLELLVHLPISTTSLNIVCSSCIADCTVSSIPTKKIVWM